MAQPSSLPSFNPQSMHCDLYVVAKQVKESRKEPIEPLIDPSFVHLNIDVSATLFSDDQWNDKVFKCHSMVGTQSLMSSSTIDSPPECRELIRNVLVDMGIPLEFRKCTWRHKYLKGHEEIHELPGVEGVDGLVENVCWFLYEVKNQAHNQDFTILPVNLAISKKIVVPDDEFEAFRSWYERMMDADPDLRELSCM